MQPIEAQGEMSALPLKADIGAATQNVRSVPSAGIVGKTAWYNKPVIPE